MDPSMMVTDEERQWALSIKRAVEAASDITLNLSDFEYCQHGFIARDDLDVALDRIRCLQAFREEYRIQDTVSEGMILIKKHFAKHPWYVLSVDRDANMGHFVFTIDRASFFPESIREPEDWKIHLVGMYYILHCMHSDLKASREGIVVICECEGMGWDNVSVAVETRVWDELWSHYAVHHKEISWLHTPMTANLLHAMLKSIVSDTISDKITLGCHFEGFDDRISGIFQTPTPEIARNVLLEKIQEFLATRYRNIASFSLE